MRMLLKGEKFACKDKKNLKTNCDINLYIMALFVFILKCLLVIS